MIWMLRNVLRIERDRKQRTEKITNMMEWWFICGQNICFVFCYAEVSIWHKRDQTNIFKLADRDQTPYFTRTRSICHLLRFFFCINVSNDRKLLNWSTKLFKLIKCWVFALKPFRRGASYDNKLWFKIKYKPKSK